ncbi:MAG: prohibitin family protein [Archangium sp.]
MSPPKPSSWLDRAEEQLEEQLEKHLESFWQQWSFWIYMAGGLLLLLLIFFWPRIFVTVHSGEQGVLFRLFGQGTVTDETYGEGLHFVLPWDTLFIYDVRVQQRHVEFQMLTNDGLEVRTDVSVRYHPRIEQVGLLQKRVGPEYFDKIVRPVIISMLRRAAGGLKAEELYSTRRVVLQEAIQDSLRQLESNYLVLDELLIERLVLPEDLQRSIQNKKNAEQVMLEYDYRLKTESKEAERKRIEAQGVRDFQDIISKGISEELLRWRGIEATLALAKSDNAKVVVVGGGKDGLPLILDTNTEPRGHRSAGAAENKPPAAAVKLSTGATAPNPPSATVFPRVETLPPREDSPR